MFHPKFKCPKCDLSLVLNHRVGRPYLFIYCDCCNFRYGMMHRLLRLPEGMNVDGISTSLLDLPEIPDWDKAIVNEECGERFVSQVHEGRLAVDPLSISLFKRLTFTDRFKLKFKFALRILFQGFQELKQQLLPHKKPSELQSQSPVEPLQ